MTHTVPVQLLHSVAAGDANTTQGATETVTRWRPWNWWTSYGKPSPSAASVWRTTRRRPRCSRRVYTRSASPASRSTPPARGEANRCCVPLVVPLSTCRKTDSRPCPPTSSWTAYATAYATAPRWTESRVPFTPIKPPVSCVGRATRRSAPAACSRPDIAATTVSRSTKPPIVRRRWRVSSFGNTLLK